MNEQEPHDRPDPGELLIDLLLEKRIITRQELAETAERLAFASYEDADSPYLADALVELLEQKGIVSRGDLKGGV